MPDYYAILGVPSTADRATIQAAYRRLCLLHHPDRGGTHEQQVLLNEAFYILTNLKERANHDADHATPQNHEVHALALEDTRRAKQWAQEYPRQWSEFERWLDGFLADFARTEFQEGKGPGVIGAIPTSNTVSGNLFIFVGGVLGVILLFYPILEMMGPKARGMYIAILAIGVPFAIGGWIGALIHKVVGGALSIATPTAPSSPPPPPVPPPSPPVETKIVACVTCGQKLRVPVMSSELLVKCKACGNRFALPPG